MQATTQDAGSRLAMRPAPPRSVRHHRLPRHRARLQHRHPVHHPRPALAQRRAGRLRYNDAPGRDRAAASDSKRAAGGRMMRAPTSVGLSGRRSKAAPESPRYDFGRAGGADLRRHAWFVTPAQIAGAKPTKTRPASRAPNRRHPPAAAQSAPPCGALPRSCKIWVPSPGQAAHE